MRKFLLICLIVISGCKEGSTNADDTNWESIHIFSENNAVITLNNSDDSSIVNDHHRGSIFYRPKKITVDTLKVYFTQAEKDTIFQLSKQIIAAPVNKNLKFCTEFIGSLKVVINYYSFKQQAEYSSICDWNNLSPQTVHLHKILRRKIGGVYLGERNSVR